MCVTPFTAKTAIYRHFEMDPRGENQNSFFPETMLTITDRNSTATSHSHRHSHSTSTFKTFSKVNRKSKVPALRCRRVSKKAVKAQQLLVRGKKPLNMRHFHTPKRSTWSICGKRTTTNWKVKMPVKCGPKWRLIDKYKEKKDWNRKQSGGNLKKSPFYDLTRFSDVVILCKGECSAFTQRFHCLGWSKCKHQSSPKGSVTDSDVANNEKSPDDVRKERRQRKRRRNTAAEQEESAIASTLEGVKEQGDKLTTVLRRCRNLKRSKSK